jgi:hypothetical protein
MAPHWAQNLLSPGFSWPHRVQNTVDISALLVISTMPSACDVPERSPTSTTLDQKRSLTVARG